MKRFATLKNLSETVKSDQAVDWQHYAHVIERFQDEGKYIWKLNCSFEENAYRENETEQQELMESHEQKQKTVEQWHKLIADAIRLLHQNEPPDSAKAGKSPNAIWPWKKRLALFPAKPTITILSF